MQASWDSIWINGSVATGENGYGFIEHGAIAVKNNEIAWVGEAANLPGKAENLAKQVHDLLGCCITPGLIDCHTHLVYAGNRANEFEMRLQGKSYEEIAKQGGGIMATVSATRSASENDLLKQSLPRVRALMSKGVTTIEIKSGYGLDWQTEAKILRVAKIIGDELPVTIKTTFLGAHTFPPEFKQQPEQYVDYLCDEMIPAVAKEKLADAIDVFCETIAFNIQQTERIFKVAKSHNLAIKCHAEQLSDSGSALLAAKYQALSADHLEYANEKSVQALADAGTVAVLLPGAYYYLREKSCPPVPLFRQYNVPIAIATDCNPGTSPTTSLPLMMNMACTLFRLTPEETFSAVTKNAARALGIEKTCGTLSIGKHADFAIWDISHPRELSYVIDAANLISLVKNGEILFD